MGLEAEIYGKTQMLNLRRFEFRALRLNADSGANREGQIALR